MLLTGVGSAAAQNLPSDSSGDYFEAKVRPILANNCYSCHTNSALSGLRLDTLDSMKKGGKRGGKRGGKGGGGRKAAPAAAASQTNGTPAETAAS